MIVREITESIEKEKIVRSVLEALPDWFGVSAFVGRKQSLPGLCDVPEVETGRIPVCTALTGNRCAMTSICVSKASL